MFSCHQNFCRIPYVRILERGDPIFPKDVKILVSKGLQCLVSNDLIRKAFCYISDTPSSFHLLQHQIVKTIFCRSIYMWTAMSLSTILIVCLHHVSNSGLDNDI